MDNLNSDDSINISNILVKRCDLNNKENIEDIEESDHDVELYNENDKQKIQYKNKINIQNDIKINELNNNEKIQNSGNESNITKHSLIINMSKHESSSKENLNLNKKIKVENNENNKSNVVKEQEEQEENDEKIKMNIDITLINERDNENVRMIPQYTKSLVEKPEINKQIFKNIDNNNINKKRHTNENSFTNLDHMVNNIIDSTKKYEEIDNKFSLLKNGEKSKHKYFNNMDVDTNMKNIKKLKGIL